MNCPYCLQGFVYRQVKVEGEDDETIEMKVPCDECGGTSVLHCCEGLMEHE